MYSTPTKTHTHTHTHTHTNTHKVILKHTYMYMYIPHGCYYRVSKKTEPCIKYAKYQFFVNIAEWKVYGLSYCSFFAKKYPLVFKIMSVLEMRSKTSFNVVSIMRRTKYLGYFTSILIDFKSTKFKCKYTVMYIWHCCIFLPNVS